MNKNILTFGLDKVHYAIYTEGQNGGIGEWKTPKYLADAVSFTPSSKGNDVPFYANNKPRWTFHVDSGYEGDIEVSEFPVEFLVDVLGWQVDKNGLLIEASNVVQRQFALLFEVEGTAAPLRVVYYCCAGSKPNKSHNTMTDTVSLNGETMNITAMPIDFGNIRTSKASIFKHDNPTAFNNFFKKVMLPDFSEDSIEENIDEDIENELENNTETDNSDNGNPNDLETDDNV